MRVAHMKLPLDETMFIMHNFLQKCTVGRRTRMWCRSKSRFHRTSARGKVEKSPIINGKQNYVEGDNFRSLLEETLFYVHAAKSVAH